MPWAYFYLKYPVRLELFNPYQKQVVENRFPGYVPKVLCSEGSMFRRFYVPKVLCSEGSMFRMSIGTTTHWSSDNDIIWIMTKVNLCLFRANGNTNWDSFIIFCSNNHSYMPCSDDLIIATIIALIDRCFDVHCFNDHCSKDHNCSGEHCSDDMQLNLHC